MFFPQSALDLLKSAFIKKEFLHISAGLPEDRLLDKMGWQDINQMMRENRLTAPRLRLCKNGQTIPEGRLHVSAYTPSRHNDSDDCGGKILRLVAR